MTLGSKVEHNDYTGFEFEPNVRLQWTWTPNQTLWSAISRAARTPSRIDRDLAEPAPPAPLILRGGRNYGSEYVTAYELGYRGEVSSTASPHSRSAQSVLKIQPPVVPATTRSLLGRYNVLAVMP